MRQPTGFMVKPLVWNVSQALWQLGEDRRREFWRALFQRTFKRLPYDEWELGAFVRACQ